MHIYYLIHYFPPELNGGATRASDLARLWAAQGHQVTVLTGFPNHPSGYIPIEYKGKTLVEEEIDGYRVRRSYIYATPNKGTYKRLLNHASLTISTFLGSALRERPDIVIASSPPLFLGVAGYALSRLKRTPLIFEVRDIWPQQAIDLGMLKNSRVIRTMEQLEMFLYRKASMIVGVAQSTKNILAERGVLDDKIRIIPNATDLARFSPGEQNQTLCQQLNLSNKFVVSYIGTMGLSQGLTTVIGAAQQLQDKAPDIHFLFVGDGADRQHLLEQAATLQLKNITFLEPQPREVIPDYYRLSHTTLVPLRKTRLFEATIPSKIFEIMACEVPVILGVKGEAERIIQTANAGLCVTPESVDELTAAILYLKSNPEIRRQFGHNGRNYVATHYNRENLAREYSDLLCYLTQK